MGEPMLTKENLEQMVIMLDSDQDGSVSKDEFKLPYLKMFPTTTPAEFDKTWKKIDKNGDGNLSLQELAAYYGVKLTAEGLKKAASGTDVTNDEMTDEQILEALQLQATLEEMRLEREASNKPPESATANRRGSSNGVGESRKKNSSNHGVTTVRMPAKVQTSIDDKRVLFLQACELGEPNEIRTLMGECDIRMEDDKGEMPLHKVARHGLHNECRDLLAKSGDTNKKTDLNWQDKQGKSPLFYAVEYGHADLVQLFLDRGADVQLESNNGWTVLHSAVNSNKPDILKLILNHNNVDHKSIIDYQDKSKRTALHIAAFKSQPELVEVLINKGADIKLMDSAGLQPVALAKKAGRRRSKELLEEAES